MPANDQAQPIIKKVKKVQGGGHHGGAWKVAYADFVTAMMAFFMLMWLLNATSEEQRRGLADYFSPTLPISEVSAGGAALFNGDTIFSTEQAIASGTGGSSNTRNNADADDPVDDPSVERDTLFDFMAAGPEGEDAGAGLSEDASDAEADRLAAEAGAPEPGPAEEPDAEALAAAMEAERDRQMAEIADAFERIREREDGGELLEHLKLKITPEGLMIEVADVDGEPLFSSGSADASPLMQALMEVVAPIVAKLSNDIMITGHTDAQPFAASSRTSNWELSADRANAARRLLVSAGLPEARLERIAGVADRQPLSEDPYAPENRRIGITLLRQDRAPIPLPERAALPVAPTPAAAIAPEPPAR